MHHITKKIFVTKSILHEKIVILFVNHSLVIRFVAMETLSANPNLFCFVSAIAIASFGFIFQFYFSESLFIMKLLKSEKGEPRFILFQRILGVLLFGIIPLFFILFSSQKSIADFGVIPPVTGSYFWILILSVVVVTINYFNSQSPQNLGMYPQIRAKEWSLGLIILSASGWMAYFLAYEFLYRGFLLFSAITLLGLWPAIIVNTAIYSLVHLPKGMKETLGAIPFGILLCYLTSRTGSIWIAVFVHLVMALSNEWFSLRAHPQMFVKIRLK